MKTSFPMYTRTETVDAHRNFYALIRTQLAARGIDSPAEISETEDLYDAWEDPQLFLSQTCGLPYRLTLHNKVHLVGTPDFKLEGCPPGYYRSAMVVRREDKDKSLEYFKDSLFIYNSEDSHSGYATAYEITQKRGFWFENRVPSGSHRASACAIAEGRADIAAIDAMTWKQLLAYEQYTENLSVIDWTAPSPGTPYITSLSNNASAMYEAINAAIDELVDHDRQILGIHSLVKISAQDYLAVDNPPV